MRDVLVIADTGPGRPASPESLRLGQLARIAQELGLCADLMLRRRADTEAGEVDLAQTLFRRVAVTDARPLAELTAGPVAPFAPEAGWDLAMLLGAAAGEEADCAGLPVLRDHCERPVPEAPPPGLHLAISDALIGAALGRGEGLRLPYRPPVTGWGTGGRTGSGTGRLPQEGRRIGWAGTAGASVIAGWETVLGVIARRSGTWADGVLLAGAWTDAITPLPAMPGLRLWPEGGPDAAFKALDLAVLPGEPSAGEEIFVAEAIRAGVPVFTLDAVAERFGDRWRFATAPDAAGLADRLVEEGILAAIPAGHQGRDAALAAAEAEMDRDAAAMEAWVMEHARALIASS